MRQQPKAKEAWREPKNRKQKDKATKTTAGARELGLTQQHHCSFLVYWDRFTTEHNILRSLSWDLKMTGLKNIF